MRFLLVCEGSSDAALREHILNLVDGYTLTTPEGEVWHRSTGGGLANKIRNGFDNFGNFDLLFVHRDTDNARVETRHAEIAGAIQESGYAGPWVGIVPVRMTEAWLLSDEFAIRRAAGKPQGKTPLDLPHPRDIERVSDPKGVLATALLKASESRGRRRRKSDREFPRLRRQLLQNLYPGGALEQVPSWARFRDDTVAALRELRADG